jgi:hypothetical protein
MGMIFGKSWQDPSEDFHGGSVSYWFASKKDPRFKGDGYVDSLWAVHAAATKDIEALEKRLGVTAPDDIEFGGMKK